MTPAERLHRAVLCAQQAQLAAAEAQRRAAEAERMAKEIAGDLPLDQLHDLQRRVDGTPKSPLAAAASALRAAVGDVDLARRRLGGPP